MIAPLNTIEPTSHWLNRRMMIEKNNKKIFEINVKWNKYKKWYARHLYLCKDQNILMNDEYKIKWHYRQYFKNISWCTFDLDDEITVTLKRKYTLPQHTINTLKEKLLGIIFLSRYRLGQFFRNEKIMQKYFFDRILGKRAKD